MSDFEVRLPGAQGWNPPGSLPLSIGTFNTQSGAYSAIWRLVRAHNDSGGYMDHPYLPPHYRVRADGAPYIADWLL